MAANLLLDCRQVPCNILILDEQRARNLEVPRERNWQGFAWLETHALTVTGFTAGLRVIKDLYCHDSSTA